MDLLKWIRTGRYPIRIPIIIVMTFAFFGQQSAVDDVVSILCTIENKGKNDVL